MLIASLVEFAFAKPRMRQTHNSHLANFDMTSFTNVDECGNILTVPSSLPTCCSCTGSRTSDLPHKTKAQWTCKALTYVIRRRPMHWAEAAGRGHQWWCKPKRNEMTESVVDIAADAANQHLHAQ